MNPIDDLDLPTLSPPKEIPTFPEKHLLDIDLPKLIPLPDLLPTETKLVIGMIGWAIEAMPKNMSKHCHFPTGLEDLRFPGGKTWERFKVTAIDDIRPYTSVVLVDDKRHVMEQSLISTIKETLVLNSHKNIKSERETTTSSLDTAGFNKLAGLIYASHDLDVYVDQSMDGANWDDATRVKAYTGKSNNCAFSVELVAPFARIRIENSGTEDTTVCRQFAQMSAGF